MGSKTSNLEIVEFVKQTTNAITVISESTKQLEKTTTTIQEAMNAQSITNAKSFEQLGGKMDGLLTMFKYVIAPLVGGILALVGIKMIFKL